MVENRREISLTLEVESQYLALEFQGLGGANNPVELVPGQSSGDLKIKVARHNVQGPIRIDFRAATGSGVSAEPITISGGKDTATFKLSASKTARPKNTEITLEASIGDVGERLVLPVKVRTRELRLLLVDKKLGPQPVKSIEVGRPSEISPNAARLAVTSYEVVVTTSDLDKPVTVTFDGLPGGVKIKDMELKLGKGERRQNLNIYLSTISQVGETGIEIIANCDGLEARTKVRLRLRPSTLDK